MKVYSEFVKQIFQVANSQIKPLIKSLCGRTHYDFQQHLEKFRLPKQLLKSLNVKAFKTDFDWREIAPFTGSQSTAATATENASASVSSTQFSDFGFPISREKIF